ncbi:EsaB/YukD family protein [Streptomyces sp. NPDC059740]|uniref:EsaB/YukD family protein n=1 Tax=Streptomyces sp. NPDC059740 TaxID=3346926 RepID=UPI00365D5C74
MAVGTEGAAVVGERRTALSRVTLVADGRRFASLLPATEPLGELLPGVLLAVAAPQAPTDPPYRVLTADGTVLPATQSLASAGVVDGAVLHLVAEQPATGGPPPAAGRTTGDAPDGTGAEDDGLGAWRWGERARNWSAGVAAVLLALFAGGCAVLWYGRGPAAVGLGVLAVPAVAVGIGAARLGHRRPGVTAMAFGGATGALAAWESTTHLPLRLAAAAVVLALVAALLDRCTEAGAGGRAAAVALLAAAGLWEVCLAVTSPDRAAVLAGLVTALGLGQLPRLALVTAGLTGLDDRRSAAAPVSRLRVATALAATHRGLAPATVVVAVATGAAGFLAAHAGGHGPAGVWGPLGAASLCVVLWARTRAYPLTVEVLALGGAATVVAVRLALAWASSGAPAGGLVLLAALALLPPVLCAVGLPPAVRQWWARLVDLLEIAGLAALVLVTLGALGVYEGLAHLL